jgi:hypothetical protein
MEIIFLIVVIIVGIITFYLRKWFLEGYRGTYIKDNEKNNNLKKQSPNTRTNYWLGKIIETNTSYQLLGVEEREIDNSKNDGLVKRKLTISREWKKTISIDKEKTNHYKGKIGFPYGLIEGEISKSVAETYGSTQEDTRYFSEEVELEVAAHSKIILFVKWKIIWQNGEIEVFSNTNEKIKIPFKIVKGITFDQTQERIN